MAGGHITGTISGAWRDLLDLDHPSIDGSFAASLDLIVGADADGYCDRPVRDLGRFAMSPACCGVARSSAVDVPLSVEGAGETFACAGRHQDRSCSRHGAVTTRWTEVEAPTHRNLPASTSRTIDVP